MESLSALFISIILLATSKETFLVCNWLPMKIISFAKRFAASTFPFLATFLFHFLLFFPFSLLFPLSALPWKIYGYQLPLLFLNTCLPMHKFLSLLSKQFKTFPKWSYKVYTLLLQHINIKLENLSTEPPICIKSIFTPNYRFSIFPSFANGI